MIIRNFLTRRLARRLHGWAARYMLEHHPDQIIGGIESPYLYRWHLRRRTDGEGRVRKLWWNVYLHEIVRDDDDRALHDHPFPSMSIIIEGPLAEVRRTRRGDTIRHFEDGDIVFRTARATHRLFLPDYGLPARTIFVIGPRVRRWGFFCKDGWVHWKQFETQGGCE